ncbi:dinucleotide-utilizing enzyme [Frankia torreyi]|uniref:Dinucleotide-utilizing enzyme n=1 Tax=Frankia torreyi TaxID=1856 RepID=A0A0D8BG11_9ACTN|nr:MULTISPECIES: ThiF family adenylyltransferase [Frankia]KJE22909.1 dinucleotide-utilizing enzyme [Frankia torreyi]KQC36918.1 thiamine biosynthesis protein ThiF [Frankia sp. ACN1ag]KQM02101.1 dinucleotide-utilizing enzyme [Frankia sp. CpI1-P]
MRPILKPGLRRLWHNSSTLQLGIDPARAVLVTDLGPPHAALLDALDGRRTLEQLRLDGGEAARDLLDLLGRAGLLDDAATAPGTTPLSPADRDRLSPDLAALSIRSADPARPRRVLAARRAARVLVRGAGRVGAQISTLLAAAGVGRVVVDDAEVTTAADVSPGGLRLDDVGRPRALAAGTAMTRVRRQADRRPGLGAAGSASLPPPGRGNGPGVDAFDADLIVLAPVGPPTVAPGACLDLERRGTAHLLAGVRETTGIVGPLVVPAATACLHCQHLHRHARDPVWPMLAMQLVRPRPAGHDPCEITLASLVAAIAAMQALAFLDLAVPPSPDPGPGFHQSDNTDLPHAPASTKDEMFDTPNATPKILPVTADGALELALPDWRLRRRSWPVHPNCPCRTARSAAVQAGTDA